MTPNKDKDNDNVTQGTEKPPHKKQIYRRRHDKNHHTANMTDFVGETPDIDGKLCLLSEKLEKELPGTSFMTNSIILS